MDDRQQRSPRSREVLDRKVDQWLQTGRQLVDGVSGRRPGQRRGSLDLDSVGKWVGEKVEWLLEDDEDWREPWQEPTPPMTGSRPSKRPLDAISRRGGPASAATPAQNGLDRMVPERDSQADGSRQPVMDAQAATPSQGDDAWPDDESFRVAHWKRGPEPMGRRPLPRSSRRRA